MTSDLIYQGFLIDDDQSAEASASLFSSQCLSLTFLRPSELEAFAQELFDHKPSILVIDYRLDQVADAHGSTRRYKASALTQQLRDLAIEQPANDCPIVLHSAESKLRDVFHPDQTAHDLFDDTILKDGRKDSSEIRRRLVGLAEGYRQLISFDLNYLQNRFALFGLEHSRGDFIDHQEVQAELAKARAPHVLAQFLLRGFMARNAILLDEDSVVARAGIRGDSASLDCLRSALQEAGAEYQGVFAGVKSRWWRAACEVVLTNWMGGSPMRFSADERAKRLSVALQFDFVPARSTWSQSECERFTHACVVCRKPTHAGHSVALFDTGNGVLAERRRLCFDCLQNDRDKRGRPLVIDMLDQEVAQDVRDGRLVRSGG